MASTTTKSSKRKSTHNPFTLEYLAYGKLVWELGHYEMLPPHLQKRDPYPYHDKHEPAMVRMQRLMRRYTPWYKEYFNKLEDKREENLRQYYKSPGYYRNKPPIIANCAMCFIKQFYPNLEKHPPNPWPNTYCYYKEEWGHHFTTYEQPRSHCKKS